MVSNRQLEERAARKERILDAALEVFSRIGIEGSTMNEIAAEAGFGKASLYYYFPSKEEVFHAILERGWMRLLESIESVVIGNDTPRNKFIKLLNAIADQVKLNRTLYEFLFIVPKSIPVESIRNGSWKTYQNRLYATLHGILEDGVAIGDFVDIQPDLLMRAIGGIFHSLIFPGDAQSSISDTDLDTVLSKFLHPK